MKKHLMKQKSIRRKIDNSCCIYDENVKRERKRRGQNSHLGIRKKAQQATIVIVHTCVYMFVL